MFIGKRISPVAAAAGLMVFLAMPLAHGQEISESHVAAAAKAVKATQSSNRFDNILPGLAEQAKAELIRNMPDQEVKITEIVDEAAIALAPRRADLEKEVAQIFAKVFSEQELTQLADFFGSELGQKFLSESPLVLRETDRAARVWSQGVQRDIAQAIGAKLKEAGLQ